MPDLRPTVDHTQVLALLSQHFGSPITELAPVEGGQVARTFSFRAGEQDYIVRFNKDTMLTSNFPKEAYVYQKLASTRIPLPPLVQSRGPGEKLQYWQSTTFDRPVEAHL
jgi:hygromycin-B 4-O-kinase